MPKKKENQNYLDLVPVKNPDMEFTVGEDGRVTVFVEWKGFYHRIAQRFFRRPRVSKIALDEYGSYVWLQIDGVRSVHILSQALASRFGEMEKGLSRLIKFLEILRDQRFITWKEPGV